MKIPDTSWFQEYLLDILEPLSKRVFFWENEPVRIGKLIRVLHTNSMYILFFSIIIVHTVVPSYFLLVLIYIFCFCVWVHHILTGGCIISKLEQKLIGDSSSFIDPLLDVFNIPITPQTTTGAVIMGSTIILFMMTLELCARTVLNIKSYMSFRFFS
jgi:hypothetical protein